MMIRRRQWLMAARPVLAQAFDRSHGPKVDSAFLDDDWPLNHVPR